MQMKKLNFTDRRMVYIVFFLFVVIGNLAVMAGISVPRYELASVDREFFGVFQELNPGDYAWFYGGMAAMNYGDVQRLHDVVCKYLADKRVCQILIPTAAEALQYIAAMCTMIWGPNYQKSPDYGVTFVVTPISPAADYLGPARSIRAVWTRDNFGNAWDSLPMMKNHNNLHQAKVIWTGPYGITTMAALHSEFPEPKEVEAANINTQAFQGPPYTAGIAIDAEGSGAKAAHAFEIMANTPQAFREATVVVWPQLMASLTSLIGIAVTNYIYFTKERKLGGISRVSGGYFRKKEVK